MSATTDISVSDATVDTSPSVDIFEQVIRFADTPYAPTDTVPQHVEPAWWHCHMKLTACNESAAARDVGTIIGISSDAGCRLVLRQIYARIMAVDLPGRWREEDIEAPCLASRQQAVKVAWTILDRYGLQPDHIAASVEGGIYLLYRNAINARTLEVEAFNDLDIAAIVNSESGIVASRDIGPLDFKEMIRLLHE